MAQDGEAERAFLILGRRWLEEVSQPRKDRRLPRSADELALSCLLAAVHAGHGFTERAEQQVMTNGEEAPDWFDRLLWNLCSVAITEGAPPSEDGWVDELTSHLSHANSSIRGWMMEMGWMVRPWLVAPKAVPLLLRNLADTLAGPLRAAGLAAALVDTEDEFWTLARNFSPPARFEEQYRERLQEAEDYGIVALQAPFWKLEAGCWRAIASAQLDDVSP